MNRLQRAILNLSTRVTYFNIHLNIDGETYSTQGTIDDDDTLILTDVDSHEEYMIDVQTIQPLYGSIFTASLTTWNDDKTVMLIVPEFAAALEQTYETEAENPPDAHLTAGGLKKLLEGVPDDTPVYIGTNTRNYSPAWNSGSGYTTVLKRKRYDEVMEDVLFGEVGEHTDLGTRRRAFVIQ